MTTTVKPVRPQYIEDQDVTITLNFKAAMKLLALLRENAWDANGSKSETYQSYKAVDDATSVAYRSWTDAWGKFERDFAEAYAHTTIDPKPGEYWWAEHTNEPGLKVVLVEGGCDNRRVDCDPIEEYRFITKVQPPQGEVLSEEVTG